MWRSAKILLGVSAAALGCYGAYVAAHALEGGVSYLTIAAPVVAAGAALIPPIAEDEWRLGHRVKALLWWVILIPAAATVFLSAFERTEQAKAGAHAETQARSNAVQRARDELQEAKVALYAKQPLESKAKAQKTCGPKCRTVLQEASDARQRVADAEAALLKAETGAKVNADRVPPWLLPLSLDLIAFMAIWSGLTGPRPKPQPVPLAAPSGTVVVLKNRPGEPKAVRAKRTRMVNKAIKAASNDNVTPLRA